MFELDSISDDRKLTMKSLRELVRPLTTVKLNKEQIDDLHTRIIAALAQELLAVEIDAVS